MTVDIPGDVELREGPGGAGGRGRLVDPVEVLAIVGEMSVPHAGSMVALSCLPHAFSLPNLARWLFQYLATERLWFGYHCTAQWGLLPGVELHVTRTWVFSFDIQ